MARIRSIKPEFWTSAQVMECSPLARLTFIGLWNFSDDAGRHPDNAKQIKAEIFPGDDISTENIRGILDELSLNGLVSRYVVDGTGYLQVTGWRHQRIDHPQPAKYPGAEEGIPAPIPVDSENDPGTVLPDRKDKRDRKDISPSATPTVPEDVQKVFAHWKEVHSHPKAQLDPNRLKVIREALKLYSVDDLCRCISGYLKSPHHMGENDRKTKYDDIEIFLRDAKHIDAGLKLASETRKVQWYG